MMYLFGNIVHTTTQHVQIGMLLRALACKFAYRNATPGSTLKDEYFLSRLPIVEKRLAQGGVRLAAILNRIFTSKTGIAQV